MADPVLHLLAGPNGAGKSSCSQRSSARQRTSSSSTPMTSRPSVGLRTQRVGPTTRPRSRADRRAELLAARTSFVTETVFSHESKVGLVQQACAAGYLVTLHVVAVPEELAVARVANRVEHGGHAVPEDKVRTRFHRLWPLVAEAIRLADAAFVYDNSRIKPAFRLVAASTTACSSGSSDWPPWHRPHPYLAR